MNTAYTRTAVVHGETVALLIADAKADGTVDPEEADAIERGVRAWLQECRAADATRAFAETVQRPMRDERNRARITEALFVALAELPETAA